MTFSFSVDSFTCIENVRILHCLVTFTWISAGFLFGILNFQWTAVIFLDNFRPSKVPTLIVTLERKWGCDKVGRPRYGKLSKRQRRRPQRRQQFNQRSARRNQRPQRPNLQDRVRKNKKYLFIVIFDPLISKIEITYQDIKTVDSQSPADLNIRQKWENLTSSRGSERGQILRRKLGQV